MTNSETKHFILWDRYKEEKEVCELLKRIGFSEVHTSKELLSDYNFTSGNEMFLVAVK